MAKLALVVIPGQYEGDVVRKAFVGVAVAALVASALAIAQPAQASSASSAGSAAAVASPQTLALYNMNESAGSSVLVDDSGNGFNGTIGAHVVRDGAEHTFPFHNGAAGGSVDPDHLDVVRNSALNPGTRDYSVTMRLKFTLAVGNIIQLGQSGGGGMVKFQLDDKGGGIACQFVGTLGSATVSSPTVINDGTWHTVMCARTATQLQMTLDGVVVSTIKHATGDITTNLPFAIGGKSQCNPPTVDCDYFTGQIDSVLIQTGSTVTNIPPIAVATASCTGATCSFDGSGSSDPDGQVVAYSWNFGDGTTGTGVTPTHTYAPAGNYTATLTVTDSGSATSSTSVIVHLGNAHYTAINPCRVFDTRSGSGTCVGAPVVPKAQVGNGGTLSVKVTGVAGVPTTATAVVLDLTAVNANEVTFVTVYPHGGTLPVASNLNVASAAAVPNLVIVPVGTGGSVDFFNAHGGVDLIADIAGYYSPTSPAAYSTVGPCRLFDTRSGVGVCSGALPVTPGPLGPGTTLSVKVAGVAGIPANATAVVLNVTGVLATATTFVTVWPDLGSRPATSNLNLSTPAAVSNLVIVPIGSDGKVAFSNAAGSVDLLADVAGYFSPTSAAGYTTTGPCRFFDTRVGSGTCTASPAVTLAKVGAGAMISVKVTGVGGVPSTATAVVLNVTAVGANAPTFVTVWPHGGALPLVSNLNVDGSGEAVPNLVIVPVGAGGSIDFYNRSGSVDLVADIAGYFAP